MDWNALFGAVGGNGWQVILARLLIAAFLGALIGLEREVKDRPAGLRTHMLTAMAAAGFTLIAWGIFEDVRQLEDRVPADPVRIIEAVTAGVAFLAAGAIIQSRGQVRGLTTGAGMWLAGAVGAACGMGYASIALFMTMIALAVLIVVKRVEAAWIRRGKRQRDPD